MSPGHVISHNITLYILVSPLCTKLTEDQSMPRGVAGCVVVSVLVTSENIELVVVTIFVFIKSEQDKSL